MAIHYNKNIRLGEGGYGSVFPGTFREREVAVKRVELIDAHGNEEGALKQLNHPNIVKLLQVECIDNFKLFVFELCEASLDQLFLQSNHPRKYKGPKLPYHLEIFSQLASGLKYIHSKKLIHRDIKPGNVLIFVDSTGQEVTVTMKLADFGLSRPVNERGTFTMNSGVKGSRMWYAPESLRLLSFQQPSLVEQPRGNVKSDVFALGLVFAFLILDGQHLYGSNEIEILNNTMKGNMININKIDRSHYAHDLFQKMLKNKPEDRISSSDIVEQLKSIKNKLATKENEMFELCASISKTNQIEILQNLIQQGVNINSKDKNGSNALHLLCRFSSSGRLIDAIKLLIQRGIDVNGKNNSRINALHLLCVNNSNDRLIDAIKLLTELGINVNEKDNDGSNALQLLCRFHSSERLIEAIKLLIQLGIDLNWKNKSGSKALHLLCRYNSSEILIDAIKLFIERGVQVNGKSDSGRNSLHFLCVNNSNKRLVDAIKLLTEKGIDVNGKDNNGCNALHFLCANNSSERLIHTIKLLIQRGIDVNGKDKSGSNALHYLCRYNSSDRLIEAIKLLIQHGIDVTSNGFDARLILRKNYVKGNLDKIIELLDANLT